VTIGEQTTAKMPADEACAASDESMHDESESMALNRCSTGVIDVRECNNRT
jgi:hypothetical protein